MDFNDGLEIDKETGMFSMVYSNNQYPITVELIGATMDVHCGYETEQFPMGSQVLQNWVDEIVLRG